MTKLDSQRIQSTQAQRGKDMTSGGFAARAQSAADRNADAGRANSGGMASKEPVGPTRSNPTSTSQCGGTSQRK
ncbi:hypothetical protein LOZ66_006923 [Ophidiomyces ophidiicola]|nr:hypothetical protein LOZ66_006923 [Ophidiomyces ophidiicola]